MVRMSAVGNQPDVSGTTGKCDEENLIKDDRYSKYVAYDEAGIRWLKPGLRENSQELEMDNSLHNLLFSGCTRLYRAIGSDCTVTLNGTTFWYGDDDLIAAVPADQIVNAERFLKARANDFQLVSRRPVTPRTGPTLFYPGKKGGRSL